MAKKYKIKEGVTFRPYGSNSLLTNDKLTDTMAEMFIAKNPDLLGSVIVKVESKKAPAKKSAPSTKSKSKSKSKK